MSDDEWYYQQEGDEIGPISETDLRHRLINQFIPDNIIVRGPGVSTWTPAYKLFPDICSHRTNTDEGAREGKNDFGPGWRPITLVWYYFFNGEKRGPVSRDVLKSLFEAGNIPLKTLIMRDGMDGWVRGDAVFKNLKVIPPDSSPTDLVDAGLGVISDALLFELAGVVFDVILDSVLDIFRP